MDCEAARLVLHLRRPAGGDEFSPDDTAALDRHLAGCPRCAELARRLGAFDRRFAHAVADVAVPAGLEDALLAAFDAGVRRARRRRSFARLAVAAGVLVAIGGAYGGYRVTRPQLDAETVAWVHDRTADAPEAAFDDWLRDEGLPAGVPLPIDFRMLAFVGRERLGGESVPVALFRRREPGAAPGTLKVYWVRKRSFRLENLTDAQTSRHAARVLGESPDGRYVYLAVFDTPDLDGFLRRDAAAVG